MEEGNKVIILTGPSGSGKTTIQNILLKNYGFNTPLNFTTRTPRSDEELDNYVFVTKEIFHKKMEHGDFAEHTFYNGNYYGMSKYFDLTKPNIVVLDNIGKVAMEKFLKQNNTPYYSVYLKITPELMEYRLGELRRESINTINERLKDLEFFSPSGYDLVLNADEELEEIVKTILLIGGIGNE